MLQKRTTLNKILHNSDVINITLILFYKYNAYKHIEGQNPKITGVTAEKYYPLFQISHQPILPFSKSYYQKRLHFFKFISTNTDIFGELLPRNTDRIYIKL